jgi:hypothetical protein
MSTMIKLPLSQTRCQSNSNLTKLMKLLILYWTKHQVSAHLFLPFPRSWWSPFMHYVYYKKLFILSIKFECKRAARETKIISYFVTHSKVDFRSWALPYLAHTINMVGRSTEIACNVVLNSSSRFVRDGHPTSSDIVKSWTFHNNPPECILPAFIVYKVQIIGATEWSAVMYCRMMRVGLRRFQHVSGIHPTPLFSNATTIN